MRTRVPCVLYHISSLSLSSRLFLSLSFSLYIVLAARLYPRYSRVCVVGVNGAVPSCSWASFRLGTTFARRRNFHTIQRGIRDEFNSDWSLSITSSLSGTFSLFAPIATTLTPFRFVLSYTAIALFLVASISLFLIFLFIPTRVFAFHPFPYSISLPFLLYHDE